MYYYISTIRASLQASWPFVAIIVLIPYSKMTLLVTKFDVTFWMQNMQHKLIFTFACCKSLLVYK